MNIGMSSMYGRLEAVLIKRPEDAFINQQYLDENWEKYGWLGRPDYEKILREYASFESILKQYVKNIYYLPRDPSVGIDSIFVRDPLLVTRRGAIYFQMGKKVRRNEPDAARKYLESIGIPTLGVLRGLATMEGGDILFIDEKTVAIGLSDRTNEEGIRQFREIMGDMIDEVIPVPLPYIDSNRKVMHLGVVIHIVDKDLAVIYPKWLPDSFRSYLKDRGFTFIEVSDTERRRKGTNVLMLSPKKAVIIKGNSGVKKGLEEYGIEVFEFECEELCIKGDGGPTCLTQPLLVS